ncbi:MAG: glycosyltransferase [Bacteroidales bacterium]|nr:glycosyltransferase [Bacteroidales bacterium]
MKLFNKERGKSKLTNKTKCIEIWSTYPPPYGGVSIHTMRLFSTLKHKYNLVFKNFNGTYHSPQDGIICIKNKLTKLLSYCFKRNKIIHLHSNRLLVWFIVLFFPKSNQILLTIHNQNLKTNLPLYKNIILSEFFKKVKYIFLNDQTFADYLVKKHKVSSEKVIVIPAFIPPLPEESVQLPNEIESFFKKYDKTISSFAWKLYRVNNIDTYGIEDIIDAFYLLRKDYQSVGLILIIPIIEDVDYFEYILEKIEEYKLKESILIYKKAIRNGFDVWRKSDIFLRSTITDMEGISIKEALYFNTPVIATDVVSRPDEVHLYSYGDINKLNSIMREILVNENDVVLNINIPNGVTEIDRIYNLVTK